MKDWEDLGRGMRGWKRMGGHEERVEDEMRSLMA
jgi:hypothetical protein